MNLKHVHSAGHSKLPCLRGTIVPPTVTVRNVAVFWRWASTKARNAGKTHPNHLPPHLPQHSQGQIASLRAPWHSRCVSNCSSASSDRKSYLAMGWKHRKSISACLEFQHCVHSAETRKACASLDRTICSWYKCAPVLLRRNLTHAHTTHVYYIPAPRNWQGWIQNALHSPVRRDRCADKQSNKLDNNVNVCLCVCVCVCVCVCRVREYTKLPAAKITQISSCWLVRKIH